MGHRPIRSIVQREDLDTETRTELWNVLVVLRRFLAEADRDAYPADLTEDSVLEAVWAWELKRPRDEMPGREQVWGLVKSSILRGEWFDVLDLIESMMKYFERFETRYTAHIRPLAIDAFNDTFEKYLVGYRFIGDRISPLDSHEESAAIVAAQADSGQISGARHALDRAVELLADRRNPDYPNSIKESISAVESVVKKVTGESTLGAGLNKLEASGLAIHPALRGAWSKIYGWTSDADGIRHAGIEAAAADQALAKFMLVVCSAFVSYLIEEARKSGLLA